MTTLNRMRYYRSKAFLGKIAEAMGIPDEEAHECMKDWFFKKSTTEFDDAGFDGKLQDIREFFSKVDVWIPEPGESGEAPEDTTDYS